VSGARILPQAWQVNQKAYRPAQRTICLDAQIY